ncbi:MAG: polysaccharide pyruvyl transferase family protein [candidate division SR1 bacterium]|nr:polysaccharide pyruvyl transferase family protein [candidate division SR1 bacterium]
MKINNKLNIPEKSILIVGNRSYRNLGDELILLGSVKLLLEENKKVTIASYDPEWLKKFLSKFIDTSKITFVTEIPKGIRSWIKYIRQGKLKERSLYRKVNAVIIGGGEIITEENRNSYRYRLVSLLPCLKKPRYLMGGIQIPKNLFNRFLFTRILKRTKHIFARDHETIQDLKKYGYHNVEFFMDTSYFAYDRKKHKHSTLKIQHSKFIVINLNKNAEQFLPEIIQDVKKLYNKGYAVLYVPVAKGKGSHYSDIKYAHSIQIKAGIKNQRFTILDREDDFDEFITTLAQANMVITSRLHLFLIASFLKVPTKVYPYQKKILKMKKIIENLQ